MIRPIITAANPEHLSILRSKCARVEVFDAELLSLVLDLTDTIRDSRRCLGLAAPQIGVSKAVAVVDVGRIIRRNTGLLVMVNPNLKRLERPVVMQEGCMSIPGFVLGVMRYRKVEVRFQDVNGVAQTRWESGTAAQAIQHEIDHLHGVLLTDYSPNPSALDEWVLKATEAGCEV